MKKGFIIAICAVMAAFTAMSQSSDSLSNQYLNTAGMLLQSNGKLGIGGYGEVHFNQPFGTGTRELGSLDVHRVVLFVGYNFSKNTQFISEIEFEHANELWVEQAFLQHRLHPSINFRAGLLLVPMGIINEYHEPTTFNGVERPSIDSKLAPSTWREIGAGFSGTVAPLTFKYQVYVVGGLNGYDTKGIMSGSKGLRDARQKGSSAYVTSPNLAGKIEYYGIRNLNIGLSGYFGKSQSKLYAKLDEEISAKVAKADSSVVGISMIGADARYRIKGFDLRGQFYSLALSNTDQYNKLTAVNGKGNDLGKLATGYYAEAGYNIFQPFGSVNRELVAFARYEYLNMHQKADPGMVKNNKYETTTWTTGLTYFLTKNAVLKADLQMSKTAADSQFTNTFNAGIGVMF